MYLEASRRTSSEMFCWVLNKPLGMIFENSINCLTKFPVNTGRKLNVHKTFRRRPGRPVPTGFVVIFKQNRTSVWKSFWNVVMFI